MTLVVSLTSENLNSQRHSNDNENRDRFPNYAGEKAHIQILPVTLNIMWPQMSNLISQVSIKFAGLRVPVGFSD